MGLSGLIAGGVQGAVDDIQERRLQELARRIAEQQRQDALQLQRDQLDMQRSDRETDNARQQKILDLAELKRVDEQQAAQTDRNVGLDAANVLQMPGMSNEAKANELMASAVRNPKATSAPMMMKVIEGLTKVPEKVKPIQYTYTDPKTGTKSLRFTQPDQIPANGIDLGREPQKPDDTTELSPAGIEIAALNYKRTGMLPPLGMGDKTTRKKIIDRSATLTADDISRIEAGGNDIASNKADYGADTDSLKQLQKQRDAIGAFEETALKNLDLFLNAAGKIPDMKSPGLNTPIRAINERILGSPEMAAYQTARRTVIPEFAKILANPGMSGQLSDSARKEVEDVVSGNATLAQTIAAANILKQDTANRRQSYDDAIASIRNRRQRGSAPASKPEAPASQSSEDAAAKAAALLKKYGKGE